MAEKKSLLVIMTVYKGDCKKDTILNQRVINFLDARARQMLARTAWWAMHEGHELVTRPKEPGEDVDIIDT